MGRLNDLEAQGQAVWLDFLDRKFLAEGGLQKLVDEDGLTGVTSNPSIFGKAMGQGTAYDESLAAYDRDNPGAAAIDRYEALAIDDVKTATDTLRPVYDRLGGKDGDVSLEVSPYIADETDATIAEAAKLWMLVNKPNLMIKIPGTLAGAPAIAASVAKGININVTLLFGLEAYRRVAEAYAAGLEERVRQGQSIDKIASVASFFVSRIDTAIDKSIDQRIAGGDVEADALKALRGKVAIANAKMAYQWYLDFLKSDRWQALAAKGAMPQRLLWASTGTKDPDYSDVLYLDRLIGADTINTVPPRTMDAFSDHGTVEETLTRDIDQARQILVEAERLGLDLDGVTDRLVEEGVASVAKTLDELLGVIARKEPTAA